MAADLDASRPAPRRYAVVFAAQLVLVAAAVLVSQLGLGRALANAAILGIAALNALIVAFLLMGVGRDGRFVSVLFVVLVIFIAGLLIWPAWDVYVRTKVF